MAARVLGSGWGDIAYVSSASAPVWATAIAYATPLVDLGPMPYGNEVVQFASSSGKYVWAGQPPWNRMGGFQHRSRASGATPFSASRRFEEEPIGDQDPEIRCSCVAHSRGGCERPASRRIRDDVDATALS